MLTGETDRLDRDLYLGVGAAVNRDYKLILAGSNPKLKLEKDLFTDMRKHPSEDAECTDNPAEKARMEAFIRKYDDAMEPSQKELPYGYGKEGFKAPKEWKVAYPPVGEVPYSNPLDVEFGDPYVLLASDGKSYMYGTGGVKDGFGCYRSDNLADWEYLGQVYRGNTPESWACSSFWAPEVYEKDGKQLYCVYHGRTAATGHQRVVFINKMYIRDGRLTVEGPTTGAGKL